MPPPEPRAISDTSASEPSAPANAIGATPNEPKKKPSAPPNAAPEAIPSVYGSASVAAVGSAAHEAGHALQQHEDYPYLSLRTHIVPIVNIGSHLAWPIFLAGILFSWTPLMYAGIVLFCLVVLYTLVTLPVEFNASRCAREMLADSDLFTQDELQGVSRVLTAAALTYVASFISALMQLLRLLLIVAGNRRN